MELRTSPLALVALSLGLSMPATTQEGTEHRGPPQIVEPPPAAQQDPDRPVPTPAERKAELEKERDTLQREIEFVRTRVSDSMSLLRDKLQHRNLSCREIDAGSGAVAPTKPLQHGRTAQLMSAPDIEKLGKDTMLTVGGRPVRQPDFDMLCAYLEASGSAPTEDVRHQRAMLELIRIENTIASFPAAAREAESQMGAAAAEVANGASFVETATKYSRGPLVGDAKMTITRNCPFGLFLEKEVFDAKEGAVTKVVPGLTGYVMFKVEKHINGATRPEDKVEGRIIVVPYHPDPKELDKARARAALGQVALMLRDEQVVGLLPAMLRPGKVLPAKELPTKQNGKQDAEKTDGDDDESAKAVKPIKNKKQA